MEALAAGLAAGLAAEAAEVEEERGEAESCGADGGALGSCQLLPRSIAALRRRWVPAGAVNASGAGESERGPDAGQGVRGGWERLG